MSKSKKELNEFGLVPFTIEDVKESIKISKLKDHEVNETKKYSLRFNVLQSVGYIKKKVVDYRSTDLVIEGEYTLMEVINVLDRDIIKPLADTIILIRFDVFAYEDDDGEYKSIRSVYNPANNIKKREDEFDSVSFSSIRKSKIYKKAIENYVTFEFNSSVRKTIISALDIKNIDKDKGLYIADIVYFNNVTKDLDTEHISKMEISNLIPWLSGLLAISGDKFKSITIKGVTKGTKSVIITRDGTTLEFKATKIKGIK